MIASSLPNQLSYESNRYNQGLLTRSLLEAFRGAATTAGEQGNMLEFGNAMRYAVNRVPVLAEFEDAKQEPIIRFPKNNYNLFIGSLKEGDEQKLKLKPAKPVVIQPYFQDEQKLRDILNLSTKVEQELVRMSRGNKKGETKEKEDPNFLYLKTTKFADAISLTGAYLQNGQSMDAKINMFYGNEDHLITIKNASTADDLVEKIIDELLATMQKIYQQSRN